VNNVRIDGTNHNRYRLGNGDQPNGMDPEENKAISACHSHENKQILDRSLTLSQTPIAIDAPLSLPIKAT